MGIKSWFKKTNNLDVEERLQRALREILSLQESNRILRKELKEALPLTTWLSPRHVSTDLVSMLDQFPTGGMC